MQESSHTLKPRIRSGPAGSASAWGSAGKRRLLCRDGWGARGPGRPSPLVSRRAQPAQSKQQKVGGGMGHGAGGAVHSRVPPSLGKAGEARWTQGCRTVQARMSVCLSACICLFVPWAALRPPPSALGPRGLRSSSQTCPLKPESPPAPPPPSLQPDVEGGARAGGGLPHSCPAPLSRLGPGPCRGTPAAHFCSQCLPQQDGPALRGAPTS